MEASPSIHQFQADVMPLQKSSGGGGLNGGPRKRMREHRGPGGGLPAKEAWGGGGGGGAKLVSVHPPSTIHPSTTEKISISLRPGLGLRSPIVERKKQ